jgi:NRPS condensation-like uncharacterized protein
MLTVLQVVALSSVNDVTLDTLAQVRQQYDTTTQQCVC